MVPHCGFDLHFSDNEWFNMRILLQVFALFFLLEDFCHPGFWDDPLFLHLLCLLWQLLLPRFLTWVSPTSLLLTTTPSLHSPWMISSVPTASRYLHSGNSQNYISSPNLSVESGNLFPDCAPQLTTRQPGNLQLQNLTDGHLWGISISSPAWVLLRTAPLPVLTCCLIHCCNPIPSLLPPGWSSWNMTWILSLSLPLPQRLWMACKVKSKLFPRMHIGLSVLGKRVPL